MTTSPQHVTLVRADGREFSGATHNDAAAAAFGLGATAVYRAGGVWAVYVRGILAGEMTTPADALPETAEADGVTVALRSGEKFRRVIGTLDPETVCSRHRDTPVVTAEFEWVREGIAGTRFQRLAHADGTTCEHPHPLSKGDNYPLFAYRVPTCPGCGARGEDLVTVTQEAYGDRATWSCCGHETWHSIGD